jgi:hypothetical protein
MYFPACKQIDILFYMILEFQPSDHFSPESIFAQISLKRKNLTKLLMFSQYVF